MNTISTFRKCTLTNEELLKAVDKGTDKMYIEGKIPSRCIPAQPNADYDLLVGELILRFIELTKQLQQGGVVRPEVGSVQEGELLGNEGRAKSVRGGKCKHCGQIREGHTVIGMCMDRLKHFESA